MQPGYREKIIMHAFYPKKQRFANSNVLRTVLFYASLFELAEKGILVTEDTRFWCRESETGDPVLDRIISFMVPLSGKKLSRLQLLVPRRAGEIYKKQMELMTENHYLLKEEILLIAWKVGSSYKVRKYDLLKPGITKMERALVYGRFPDRETWLTALLAIEANLMNNLFQTKEYRERAKKRYKELLGSEFHREDNTIYQLHKSLKKTLDTQKAVRAVTRT
jgi:hypothetical protein